MCSDGTMDYYLVAPYTFDDEGHVVLKEDWEKFVPERAEANATLEGQKNWRIREALRSQHASTSQPETEAQYLFKQAFPNGYKTIPTPADGYMCMIFAIVLVMLEQHTDLYHFSTDELEKILEKPSIKKLLKDAGMTNKNDFTADQGGAFLHHAGLEQGLNL